MIHRLLARLGAATLSATIAHASVASERVAMVTDLVGEAELSAGGTPVEILDELGSNVEVTVAPGGRLTLVYLDSGREYSVAGTARFNVGPSGPGMLEGAVPKGRDLAVARATGLSTVGEAALSETTVTMRTVARRPPLELVSPRAVVLSTSPEFRWHALDGATGFDFKLSRAAGGVVHEERTDERRVELPGSLALEPGGEYRWQVRFRSASGRRLRESAAFRVATETLRADVERVRPAPGASVSERVLFAVWLERRDLRSKAREVWAAVARERPDAERLGARAGN